MSHAAAVFDDPEPTIGFSPSETERNGMSIKLWDLGGGRRIRGVWESYVDEIHGAIYMVDGALPSPVLLVRILCVASLGCLQPPTWNGLKRAERSFTSSWRMPNSTASRY